MRSKRIYLLPPLQYKTPALIVMPVCLLALTIHLVSKSPNEDTRYVYIIVIFFVCLPCLALFYAMRITLFYVQADENGFKSYICGRQLCTVEIDRPIYYRISAFKGRAGKIKQIIYLSNEAFDPAELKKAHFGHDLYKQLGFPVSIKTLPLLDLESWVEASTALQ